MFILKTGHQPGVYVPLRALFLVCIISLVSVLNLKPLTSLYSLTACARLYKSLLA